MPDKNQYGCILMNKQIIAWLLAILVTGVISAGSTYIIRDAYYQSHPVIKEVIVTKTVGVPVTTEVRVPQIVFVNITQPFYVPCATCPVCQNTTKVAAKLPATNASTNPYLGRYSSIHICAPQNITNQTNGTTNVDEQETKFGC